MAKLSQKKLQILKQNLESGYFLQKSNNSIKFQFIDEEPTLYLHTNDLKKVFNDDSLDIFKQAIEKLIPTQIEKAAWLISTFNIKMDDEKYPLTMKSSSFIKSLYQQKINSKGLFQTDEFNLSLLDQYLNKYLKNVLPNEFNLCFSNVFTSDLIKHIQQYLPSHPVLPVLIMDHLNNKLYQVDKDEGLKFIQQYPQELANEFLNINSNESVNNNFNNYNYFYRYLPELIKLNNEIKIIDTVVNALINEYKRIQITMFEKIYFKIIISEYEKNEPRLSDYHEKNDIDFVKLTIDNLKSSDSVIQQHAINMISQWQNKKPIFHSDFHRLTHPLVNETIVNSYETYVRNIISSDSFLKSANKNKNLLEGSEKCIFYAYEQEKIKNPHRANNLAAHIVHFLGLEKVAQIMNKGKEDWNQCKSLKPEQESEENNFTM